MVDNSPPVVSALDFEIDPEDLILAIDEFINGIELTFLTSKTGI